MKILILNHTGLSKINTNLKAEIDWKISVESFYEHFSKLNNLFMKMSLTTLTWIISHILIVNLMHEISKVILNLNKFKKPVQWMAVDYALS